MPLKTEPSAPSRIQSSTEPLVQQRAQPQTGRDRPDPQTLSDKAYYEQEMTRIEAALSRGEGISVDPDMAAFMGAIQEETMAAEDALESFLYVDPETGLVRELDEDGLPLIEEGTSDAV